MATVSLARTKCSLGFHSASTLTPDAATKLIWRKVRDALERLPDFKPYSPGNAIRLEVSFKHYRPAEVLSYLRSVERIGSRSIRYKAADMVEAADFMVVVLSYEAGLEP